MSAWSDHLPGWFGKRTPSSDVEEETVTTHTTTGGGLDHEPVVVWEAANLMEAHVVKGRLESEGIPAIIRGEALAAIYGLTAGNLAVAKVLVPAPLADKATEILTHVWEDEEEDEVPATGDDLANDDLPA